MRSRSFADDLFTQDRNATGRRPGMRKKLDLRLVQVERDHAIGAGRLDGIGTDTGTNGDSGSSFLSPLGS